MISTVPAQTKSDYLKGADFMQEIIYIIVLSFGSIITLFILTKLMGYRQMSEMSMFDYINIIGAKLLAAFYRHGRLWHLRYSAVPCHQ